jgi:hypothetical protein
MEGVVSSPVMGRHTTGSRAKGAPATAEEAAERFQQDTGFDLASHPLFTSIHNHMFAWRTVLAIAEREPLRAAIRQAEAELSKRSMRPIPPLKPIPLKTAPTEEEVKIQGYADRLLAAMAMLSHGLAHLEDLLDFAKGSPLVEKVRVGRPEDTLARALCLLLVEMVERTGVIAPMTSTQAALVAHAYGIAAPEGDWPKWTEKWRVLMNDARAEQPGTATVRERLLLAAQSAKAPLIPMP